MHIRFKHFTQAGNVQFHAGDLIELPAEHAQEHVDDGNAVIVPQAETATLRYQQAPAYPARPTAKKANKPAKARR